ncbi:hypothetical protein GGR54DRAFT_413034 [Hypoxylon sp. NC1633]|nr:hypothetical protein GGR54DRAFT_413034 [Hypoxylon sp. NC1633]
MVGIPKSNRCDFCRSRKTKCDEAWPTCGSCRKAGKECSGPSKRVKFVNNGKRGRREREKDDPFPGAPDITLSDEVLGPRTTVSLLNLKNKTTKSGATFSKMRMYTHKPPAPAKLPGSPTDLLAGKIVTYLKSSEGTGYSLGMFICTLGYTPSLLENEALFDATSLLMSTWLKLCQGRNPEEMFDLRAYGRALRSLQKAITNSRERTSSATLAAAIYLQTTEFLFDGKNGRNQISHSNGIYTLMMERGPPKPGDNFGCQLIFDSFVFIFRLLLAGQIENFFVRPEWQHALANFFVQFKDRAPAIMEMSKLIQYATIVAQIIKRFSDIQRLHPDLQDPDVLEDLTTDVDDMIMKYRALDDCTIEPLLQNKKIYEIDDPASPLGTCYTFPSPTTALYFANLFSYNIVINRIKQELNAMMGLDDPDLEAECVRLSWKIWLSCWYTQSLKPLCAVSFDMPMCVSYVSAGPAIRAYLLCFLRESESYRKTEANRWTEQAVLAHNDLLTGRWPGEHPFNDQGSEMRSIMDRLPRI